MLRKKPYIEERKTKTERHLLARADTLKSKGMSDTQIQRDAQVKHLKGKIRQARNQLAGIIELEKLIARKEEIKAEKRVTQKAGPLKERHKQDPAKKKNKSEKKDSH